MVTQRTDWGQTRITNVLPQGYQHRMNQGHCLQSSSLQPFKPRVLWSHSWCTLMGIDNLHWAQCRLELSQCAGFFSFGYVSACSISVQNVQHCVFFTVGKIWHTVSRWISLNFAGRSRVFPKHFLFIVHNSGFRSTWRCRQHWRVVSGSTVGVLFASHHGGSE